VQLSAKTFSGSGSGNSPFLPRQPGSVGGIEAHRDHPVILARFELHPVDHIDGAVDENGTNAGALEIVEQQDRGLSMY